MLEFINMQEKLENIFATKEKEVSGEQDGHYFFSFING
jgi:hypothetical protein